MVNNHKKTIVFPFYNIPHGQPENSINQSICSARIARHHGKYSSNRARRRNGNTGAASKLFHPLQ